MTNGLNVMQIADLKKIIASDYGKASDISKTEWEKIAVTLGVEPSAMIRYGKSISEPEPEPEPTKVKDPKK